MQITCPDVKQKYSPYPGRNYQTVIQTKLQTSTEVKIISEVQKIFFLKKH